MSAACSLACVHGSMSSRRPTSCNHCALSLQQGVTQQTALWAADETYIIIANQRSHIAGSQHSKVPCPCGALNTANSTWVCISRLGTIPGFCAAQHSNSKVAWFPACETTGCVKALVSSVTQPVPTQGGTHIPSLLLRCIKYTVVCHVGLPC